MPDMNALAQTGARKGLMWPGEHHFCGFSLAKLYFCAVC